MFLLSGTVTLLAQPKIYSPVSRIGLGDIRSFNLPVQQAMGGISTAFQSPIFINPNNPASLSWLRSTALDVGVYGQNTNIDAGDQQFDYWTGNISHLNLAFPIFNPINDLLDRQERDYAWGMMIGLMPFSEVGYDIVTDIQDEEFGLIRRQYTGTGGSYAVQWANGVRYKNLAVGFRAEYIFGDLREERSVQFGDLTNTLTNVYQDDINVNALRWEFGAQYKHVLRYNEKPNGDRGSERQTLTFGAQLLSQSSMRFNETNLYRTLHPVFRTVDTLVFNEDLESQGVLPGGMSVGVFYDEINKFQFGIDYSLGFWSNYESEAKPAEMDNTWRLAAGLGYTPDAGDINNYFKRMTYRIGYNMGTDPRIVNDTQIQDYRISFGFTLPFIGRRRTSYGNFSFSYGERTISSSLSESFFNIGFGFTAADNEWFVKSKFN